MIGKVLQDGVISPTEAKELYDTQESLHLGTDEASLMLSSNQNKLVEKEMKIALNNECPHCESLLIGAKKKAPL